MPLKRLIIYLCRLTMAMTMLGMVTACYVVNFFKHKNSNTGSASATFNGAVLGQPLGATAGGANEAALAQVHAVSTSHPPAAVRPDPDVFVRRMLRQYRPEGGTVARQIGQVEQFRQLLGGAPVDFATKPQKTYDATSLLAVSTVAGQICRGLVAPDAGTYPGWRTILPNAPDQEQANIAWMAQRFMGIPSAAIDPAIYPQLTAIMVAEEPTLTQNWWAANNLYAKYIPVCSALLLSADAMYY